MSASLWLSTCPYLLTLSLVTVQETIATLGEWGTLIDSQGDCKAVPEGETLTVEIPASLHAINPSPSDGNMLAPRVLQPVRGTFAAEVKIGRLQPSASTTATPAGTKLKVEAGLLLWKDEKNFLSWTSAITSDGQLPVAHLWVVRRGVPFSTVYSISDGPCQLKIHRENEQIRFALSQDGRSWMTPRIQISNLVDNNAEKTLQLGVIAVNASTAEFKAEFQDLAVSMDPDFQVHSDLGFELVFPRSTLPLLADRKVQYELELDQTAVKQVKELLSEQTAIDRDPTDRETRRANWIAKADAACDAIQEQLSETQRERLVGLAVQRFGHRSFLIGCVRDAMLLDADQRKAIEKSISELEPFGFPGQGAIVGQEPLSAKLLRATVDCKLNELNGGALRDRMTQIQGEPFFFTLAGQVELTNNVSMNPLGLVAAVVSYPEVQKELKLSRADQRKLAELIKEKSALVVAQIEKLPPLDTNSATSEPSSSPWKGTAVELLQLRARFEESLLQMLDPEQKTRLARIMIQVFGAKALALTNVATTEIELSEKQLRKLEQLRSSNLDSDNFSVIIGQSMAAGSGVDSFLSESQLRRLEQIQSKPVMVFAR